jgi:hypothetical protein
MDCHAQDGRDLKYFNYSNTSIHARSVFHGLTGQQGDQIASYIRSLNEPNPGRPWNPPYQPGPGLDSQPVSDWSAGAGLDAVLDTDAEMQPYVVPGGSFAGWAANQYLNPREIPIVFQLPDWNSWLPTIHPVDAFGAAFTASGCNTEYLYISGFLQPNNPIKYNQMNNHIATWISDCEQTYVLPLESSTNWTAAQREEVYSNGLWKMVKDWELNQEFGLEGMPQAVYGATADARGWFGRAAFDTSPNFEHVPAGPGLDNGTLVVRDYLSVMWYELQLILNDGQGNEEGNCPIDYPYVFGFIKDLVVDGHEPLAFLQLEWLVKALQEETQPGVGPEKGSNGFQPTYVKPEVLVDPSWKAFWSATSPSLQATLMQAYVQAWFNQLSKFTPQQYYQGGWASSTDVPSQLNYQITMGGQIWYMLPRLRYDGVDPNLLAQIATWAATIWPLGNWAATNTATCTPQGNDLRCSTDGP